MCGIAGIFGAPKADLGPRLQAMTQLQRHRGPDDEGVWISPDGAAGLAQTRLSILDLSASGHQPMWDHTGNFCVVFNGEIYNYLELRAQLSGYPYRSRSDTEVILAAYEQWGEDCLQRFVGMFAFLLYDRRERRLFAARDRFGVKPLYYSELRGGQVCFASEIKALHAAGLPRSPAESAWASWLAHGVSDHSADTFWAGARTLPAGHCLTVRDGRISVRRWYHFPSGELDPRPAAEVEEEYRSLIEESVRLRFRADVPVGINLSGGLDSSLLLALVQSIRGADAEVKVFSFTSGDPDYDELPWVRGMLKQTRYPLFECRITPEETAALADSVARFQDEPFGGLPTLAYAKLFETARNEGVTVLLDGQGMDEQWAGYDYYADPEAAGFVQGTKSRATRPECLMPEFAALAPPLNFPKPYPDPLRNLQYRDAFHTKIPRALRYNDRISMRASTELREPFLDHRLFETAFRQPASRKIANGTRKLLLRRIAARLAPTEVVEAPKRPVQTPQREWLRGPLREWAGERIQAACALPWFGAAAVEDHWRRFLAGGSDNSYYVWQWISAGMLATQQR
ncbi:MAG: asparagine synthase (glutamine-hydrolyzing) [Bryobacteraceae bacterium]|nr:asparagine synthase (glutamine-hydrolyzing) [Bryobacteraceae bacterium]